MRRLACIMAAVALGVLGCPVQPTGQLCLPGDTETCGKGYQCLTFCSAEAAPGGELPAPQSICAPAFGDPATGTLDAEVVISSRANFGQVANVREITQTLRVEIAGVAGVALPLLERIGGDLTIVASDVQCLSMPRLVSVGGIVTIDSNGDLARVDMPSLSEADGLQVQDNTALAGLAFPSLTILHADRIHVIEENALVDFDLERLAVVGGTLRVRGAEIVSIDGFERGCLDVDRFDPQAVCPSPLGGTGPQCNAATGDVTGVQACCTCVNQDGDCSPPGEGCALE